MHFETLRNIPESAAYNSIGGRLAELSCKGKVLIY